MDFPDHPFWDWSLRVYAAPAVEKALLELQDRHGLDVNLLLFAGWTSLTGQGRLTESAWGELVAATADWRTKVIEPLRAVRRHLKRDRGGADAEALRSRVKALELDAEHAAQLAIAGMAPRPGQSTVDGSKTLAQATANLERYAAAAGTALTGRERRLLASLAGHMLDATQA